MKKAILIFGLIIGALLTLLIFYTIHKFYNSTEISSNQLVGYSIFVLIFSFVFFGIRNYRNNKLKGLITFGEAFKTGFLIALLGSTIYVLIWLLCYYLWVPDFVDVYTSFVLSETPPEELAAKTQEMETFKEMYEKPYFVILFTYFEVLPIGTLIALVSALILKKKEKSKQ